MRIIETKKVTKVEVEDVIIGRRCDVCGKEITKLENGFYNYFLIQTWHNDWGNDSVDSHEEFDACCPECVLHFAKEYVVKANISKNPSNTRTIEIRHVCNLRGGS